MAMTIKQLLSEPNDIELCNCLFSRILDYYGDYIEPSAYTDDERVVVLAWHVSGIIGNGGIRYLRQISKVTHITL